MTETQQPARFTEKQIETLRAEYEKFERLDPASPAMQKLFVFMDNLPQEILKQLFDARIKWISSLAANRIKK